MKRKRTLITSAAIALVLLILWLWYDSIFVRATLKPASEPVPGDLVIGAGTWLILGIAIIAAFIYATVSRKRKSKS